LWMLCVVRFSPAMGQSLMLRSPTECGVSNCLWSRKFNNEAISPD
jgi:hypothetical protein